LNCCREVDYGEQLFEDDNGEIIPKGAPATYHRRMLKLNRPDLIRLRLKRKQLLQELEETHFQIDADFDEQSRKLILLKTDYLKSLLEDLIPRIPCPPAQAHNPAC
jgi:hypothetical protein